MLPCSLHSAFTSSLSPGPLPVDLKQEQCHPKRWDCGRRLRVHREIVESSHSRHPRIEASAAEVCFSTAVPSKKSGFIPAQNSTG